MYFLAAIIVDFERQKYCLVVQMTVLMNFIRQWHL